MIRYADHNTLASDETVNLTGAQADAITDAEMLAKAADLKHRIAACGKYDDAATLAWCIRRIAGRACS